MDTLGKIVDDASASLRQAADIAEQVVREGKTQLCQSEQLDKVVESVNNAERTLQQLQGALQTIQSKAKAINAIVTKLKLLSLNASIEAARAGLHGKGFAVVAEEVGRLAQSSGEASREIEGLLNASQQRVTASLVVASSKASESETICRDFVSGLTGLVQFSESVMAAIANAESACDEVRINLDIKNSEEKAKTYSPPTDLR